MVRTASTMLPLGVAAPDFSLPDTQGQSGFACRLRRRARRCWSSLCAITVPT